MFNGNIIPFPSDPQDREKRRIERGRPLRHLITGEESNAVAATSTSVGPAAPENIWQEPSDYLLEWLEGIMGPNGELPDDLTLRDQVCIGAVTGFVMLATEPSFFERLPSADLYKPNID